MTDKTIVIVEDNLMNMKLFTDLLASRGYQIVSTDTGLNAHQLTKDTQPDLVLLDINLPEVHGLEVIQHIKKDPVTQHIPIIAVTALAMKGDEEKILSEGCEAYIPKPIDVKEFLITVERFL